MTVTAPTTHRQPEKHQCAVSGILNCPITYDLNRLRFSSFDRSISNAHTLIEFKANHRRRTPPERSAIIVPGMASLRLLSRKVEEMPPGEN